MRRLFCRNRRGGRTVPFFVSLVILISSAAGCAGLKCGQKDPSPTPPAPCPTESTSSECNSACPAAPVSHSPATVSVTGSEPAPDGSVVSGEEIPTTVSQDQLPPAPPVTVDSTANQYLNERQEEIIRDPIGDSDASSISPAGYHQVSPPPAPIRENDIPNGYSGLTQTAQNAGQFQNVSQESQPSRSRVQFRTVIEE